MILFGEFFCEVGPQGFFEAPEHGCFQTTVIARMESVWERPRKARSSGEDWRQKAVVLFKGFEKARRGRLQHKAWKLVGHLILGFQRSLLDPSNTYNHIYIYIYIYIHILCWLCRAVVLLWVSNMKREQWMGDHWYEKHLLSRISKRTNVGKRETILQVSQSYQKNMW